MRDAVVSLVLLYQPDVAMSASVFTAVSRCLASTAGMVSYISACCVLFRWSAVAVVPTCRVVSRVVADVCLRVCVRACVSLPEDAVAVQCPVYLRSMDPSSISLKRYPATAPSRLLPPPKQLLFAPPMTQ